MVIGMNDLPDRFGKAAKDIHVLRMGKAGDLQRPLKQLMLPVETIGGDAVNVEGFDEERQELGNAEEGCSSDEGQIERKDELLKQHIG